MTNPVKFVKIHNSKSGNSNVIPLQTWEQLSAQPKALKNLDFLYACDEEGNRVETVQILKKVVIEPLVVEEPVVTEKKVTEPVVTIEPVVEEKLKSKKPKPEKIA